MRHYLTPMHTPDRAVPLVKMREQRERAEAWIQDIERSLGPRIVEVYGRQVRLEAIELVHGQHYGQCQLRRARVK
jgi:hypothetical protein